MIDVIYFDDFVLQLYACGEGTNGRLGLGHNNNVSSPKPIPFLSQYVIKKVAVHSGGKHAMALTLDGKVCIWNQFKNLNFSN